MSKRPPIHRPACGFCRGVRSVLPRVMRERLEQLEREWLARKDAMKVRDEVEQLRRDKVAILNMLILRATKEDRELAKVKPGHWLNQARREVEPRL